MAEERKYMYFSTVLNKPFESLEELIKEEDAFKAQEDKKKMAEVTKNNRRNEVSQKAEACKKFIDEYEQKSIELYDKYCKEYCDLYSEYLKAKKDYESDYGVSYISLKTIPSDSFKEHSGLYNRFFDAFFGK